jgi:hypothetical protein
LKVAEAGGLRLLRRECLQLREAVHPLRSRDEHHLDDARQNRVARHLQQRQVGYGARAQHRRGRGMCAAAITEQTLQSLTCAEEASWSVTEHRLYRALGVREACVLTVGLCAANRDRAPSGRVQPRAGRARNVRARRA